MTRYITNLAGFALLACSLLAHAEQGLPFGHHDPDEIDVSTSVLLYRCAPESFSLWLAPENAPRQDGDRVLPFDSAQQLLCESRGHRYSVSSHHYRGDAPTGFCAGAQAVKVGLLRDGQLLHDGYLANYCTLNGATEFHFGAQDRACTVQRLDDGPPVNRCEVAPAKKP
ncbi:hypothetical protein [Pseudomonas sp. GD03944]|uniref:hypothetical protein n=1 Tax=Pseudomonas sp. GD03944 TaxID=2975409 RepID=UPI00244ACB97|nr:hypothetical protein [Pseudomonas sp. GD03944]MDH1262762.1 hypothetical protein [Pseudomonas sp. GD03944]